MTNADKAAGFLDRYGEDRFRELKRSLDEGETLRAIGDRYGVTPEAVRQWRELFFSKVVTYQLLPGVSEMLGG